MITLDGLVLPDDIIWVDRYLYTGIQQQTFRALSGKFIPIEQSVPAGRKIKLRGDVTFGWCEMSMVNALNAKASILNYQMILDYHGNQFNVIFSRDPAPIIPTMLWEVYDPVAEDSVFFELNLIEI